MNYIFKIVLVMGMMIVIVTALLNGEMLDMQYVVRSRLKLSLEDREVPGSSPRSLSRDR